MTKEEAVATLRGYNDWRRYDGPVGEGPTQPEPLAIGEAIDTVCDALEKLDNLPSDLDEAAEEYATTHLRNNEFPTADSAFKAGAKWMQDQFEKNRLANCDKLTKEEYDLETDFATEIIEKEHRQPTFTDAINYGMRVMREKVMKEAVEGFFTKSIDGDVVFAESTALDVDPKSVKVGDKVKLIVIKAEGE